MIAQRKTSPALVLIGMGAVFALAGCSAVDDGPLPFAGVECVRPPVMHCPDEDCSAEVVTNQGPVIEPESERGYFLDYPCDLRRGEKVNLILSLHGGGSYGNWQRHYFPLLDYVDRYRLVVATPNTRGWSVNDDLYLHNIVDRIIDEVGAGNVNGFWLVGHSMGSFNSRRLVCSDYFRDKVDGYLSLSGARVGSPPQEEAIRFSIPRRDDDVTGGRAPRPRFAARPAGPPTGGARPAPGEARVSRAPGDSLIAAANDIVLDCDFSFIFSSGSHEPSSQDLPTTSTWADKYHCEARRVTAEVVDTRGGYVYDSSRQQYGTDAWGRLPRPGSALIMEYPNCDGGRRVADVTRLDKGHTEGLEPRITEKLIQMMLSAQSGKLRGTM